MYLPNLLVLLCIWVGFAGGLISPQEPDFTRIPQLPECKGRHWGSLMPTLAARGFLLGKNPPYCG